MLFLSAASSDGLLAAEKTDPSNPVYARGYAAARAFQGLPAKAAWEHAVKVAPRDADVLTQAAIAAEFRGDRAEAERLLLEAERYNHLWLPRWSLANYFFRRGRYDKVLEWGHLALLRAYGDRTALFRLCRQAGASDAVLMDQIVPPDAQNRAALVYFFIAEDGRDSLERAAQLYLEAAAPEPCEAQARPVLAAIDALLDAGRPDPARRLWALLAGRHVIPYGPWSPDTPLTNPRLDPPLDPPALDWRMARVDGVEILRGVPPGGAKIFFRGSQPDVQDLLWQILVLPGGRAWRLRFEYETRGIPAEQSGLAWRLAEYPKWRVVESAPQARLAAETWERAEATWRLPPGEGLYALTFQVRRLLGQTRIEGEIRLRILGLEAVP
jgi:tetratricopeptide (TPR) repeat protein